MSETKGTSQRLEKVRRNMLRMTSPDGFGDDKARGFGSLTAINVPPWLARADAAFDRAVTLFRLPDSPADDRSHLVRLQFWRDIRSLLLEAEENLASIAHVFETGEEPPFDVSVYLAFVRFLLRLNTQLVLAARSCSELPGDIRSFTPPDFPEGFRDGLLAAESIFATSESSIRKVLLESLTAASPALEAIRSRGHGSLTKDARERYTRAFQAFTGHFAHVGEEPQP